MLPSRTPFTLVKAAQGTSFPVVFFMWRDDVITFARRTDACVRNNRKVLLGTIVLQEVLWQTQKRTPKERNRYQQIVQGFLGLTEGLRLTNLARNKGFAASVGDGVCGHGKQHTFPGDMSSLRVGCKWVSYTFYRK